MTATRVLTFTYDDKNGNPTTWTFDTVDELLDFARDTEIALDKVRRGADVEAIAAEVCAFRDPAGHDHPDRATCSFSREIVRLVLRSTK